jgi:hypothetical protein
VTSSGGARFAFPEIACYRPAAAMRLRACLLVVSLVLPLAGCAPSIASINARPDKYYQHRVKIVGRIARMQFLPHGALLEVADGEGRRLLVRSVDPVEAETGDWVRIEGIFVPEVNVEDATLYDVLAAERIVRRGAPRFLDLM